MRADDAEALIDDRGLDVLLLWSCPSVMVAVLMVLWEFLLPDVLDCAVPLAVLLSLARVPPACLRPVLNVFSICHCAAGPDSVVKVSCQCQNGHGHHAALWTQHCTHCSMQADSFRLPCQRLRLATPHHAMMLTVLGVGKKCGRCI